MHTLCTHTIIDHKLGSQYNDVLISEALVSSAYLYNVLIYYNPNGLIMKCCLPAKSPLVSGDMSGNEESAHTRTHTHKHTHTHTHIPHYYTNTI